MGLFGGGNSKTEVDYRLDDHRQNASLNSVAGPAVVARGDVTLTYTDAGAVQGGLALADSVSAKAMALGSEALGFGRDSLSLAGRSTRDALLYGDKSSARAYGFVQDIQRQANESQRESTRAVLSSSQSAVGAVQAANTSETAKTLDTVIKYGSIAAAAVALLSFMGGK